MTSGCLDRKEVRGAIWGVHSTTDRPAGGNTGRLFLAFGGPVCADRISNCPLDRVLTYKNLIYLLNLQFIMLNNPSLLKDILSLLYKYANIFAIGFEKTHLIIDLANDSIGSSECRDSTKAHYNDIFSYLYLNIPCGFPHFLQNKNKMRYAGLPFHTAPTNIIFKRP